MYRLFSLIILVTLMLSGCGSLTDDVDVSNDSEYIYLVGKSYISKKELLIHSISTDVNKEIDIYEITDKPGFGGWYVIMQDKLLQGTELKINRVMHNIICLGCSYSIAVEISSSNKYEDHPIIIRDSAGTKILIKHNGKTIINPKLFEEI